MPHTFCTCRDTTLVLSKQRESSRLPTLQLCEKTKHTASACPWTHVHGYQAQAEGEQAKLLSHVLARTSMQCTMQISSAHAPHACSIYTHTLVLHKGHGPYRCDRHLCCTACIMPRLDQNTPRLTSTLCLGFQANLSLVESCVLPAAFGRVTQMPWRLLYPFIFYLVRFHRCRCHHWLKKFQTTLLQLICNSTDLVAGYS